MRPLGEQAFAALLAAATLLVGCAMQPHADEEEAANDLQVLRMEQLQASAPPAQLALVLGGGGFLWGGRPNPTRCGLWLDANGVT